MRAAGEERPDRRMKHLLRIVIFRDGESRGFFTVPNINALAAVTTAFAATITITVIAVTATITTTDPVLGCPINIENELIALIRWYGYGRAVRWYQVCCDWRCVVQRHWLIKWRVG